MCNVNFVGKKFFSAVSEKRETSPSVSLPTTTPTSTPQSACSLGTARNRLKFVADNCFPAVNRLNTTPDDMERRKRRALIMDR